MQTNVDLTLNILQVDPDRPGSHDVPLALGSRVKLREAERQVRLEDYNHFNSRLFVLLYLFKYSFANTDRKRPTDL